VFGLFSIAIAVAFPVYFVVDIHGRCVHDVATDNRAFRTPIYESLINKANHGRKEDCTFFAMILICHRPDWRLFFGCGRSCIAVTQSRRSRPRDHPFRLLMVSPKMRVPALLILGGLVVVSHSFVLSPIPLSYRGDAPYAGSSQATVTRNRRSASRLFMISDLFNIKNNKADEHEALPRDVKDAVKRCREATQAALQSRTSRMRVEFPVGTQFGGTCTYPAADNDGTASIL
jgi:hypothetical protein